MSTETELLDEVTDKVLQVFMRHSGTPGLGPVGPLSAEIAREVVDHVLPRYVGGEKIDAIQMKLGALEEDLVSAQSHIEELRYEWENPS